MISSGLSVQQAMRAALLARAPLLTLLGGAQIFDELPRGAAAPYVFFSGIETRDWSVCDQKAHEHFITIETQTNSRSRSAAQTIAHEIEQALDNAVLTLVDHKLVNLRIIFATVARAKSTDNYNVIQRFRAATEPL
jgi:Protein of unknown function (DUF3168)